MIIATEDVLIETEEIVMAEYHKVPDDKTRLYVTMKNSDVSTLFSGETAEKLWKELQKQFNPPIPTRVAS